MPKNFFDSIKITFIFIKLKEIYDFVFKNLISGSMSPLQKYVSLIYTLFRKNNLIFLCDKRTERLI